MNRRDAINRVAWILGGTVVGAELFLSGCTNSSAHHEDEFFTHHRLALLNEIGETILPTTSTPGAKAANVAAFMAAMVLDCYKPEEQKAFKQGLEAFEEECHRIYGGSFVGLSLEERTTFLKRLEKEAQEYNEDKPNYGTWHYFSMIRQLTMLGYFTSEVACTKAMRYLPVPGRYDGNYPYKKGDKIWALG